MVKRQWVFIPNLVASNWKRKHETEHPEHNMVPSDTNAHILLFPAQSQEARIWRQGLGNAWWGHEPPHVNVQPSDLTKEEWSPFILIPWLVIT